MLSRASTTSAAVENCWRTPPIARDGRAAAELAAFGDDDVVGAGSARWYATLAPIAPDPRRLCVPFARRCVRLRCARRRSGREAAGARRRARAHRAAPSTIFAAAWNGRRCSDARNAPTRAPASGVGSRTSGTTASGKQPARPDTAPTAPPADTLRDERLGPDEDVEPLDRGTARTSPTACPRP